ncbi:MAG: ABC transporter permease [Chloroflexi bacterium]|nr:ABC transporter permease [Chloroflexota bacterium]
MRPWAEAGQRLLANRLAVAGLCVIAALAAASVGAGLLSPWDPAAQHFDRILIGPGPDHLLGTDVLGRDILSRLLHGARTSLAVGFLVQLVYLGIGVPVGAMAAFAGGRVDSLLMRLVDLVYAFPDLLLVILLRSIFGGSLVMLLVAIGLVNWTDIARLMRGEILTLREREFVMAARCLGASAPHIVVRHLVPNALGPIIVAVVFFVPRAIFAEAALGYIGIGVRPPATSWGTMVQEGYQAIFAFPHLVLFPALAIALTMVSFTFLGDGLRDALDPRLRLARR